MDTLNDKQRAFEERLDTIVRERRGPPLGKVPAGAGFETRLRVYDARLEALIAEHHRMMQATVRAIWSDSAPVVSSASSVAAPAQEQPRLLLGGEPVLQEIDRRMLEEFRLPRYFSDVDLSSLPTIYCETLEEYFQPYAELLDVSEQARQETIRKLAQEARKVAAERGGGQFGVFWPGRGCYLNGWLFAYRRAPSATAALRDPTILLHILNTVAHEKLGHGFISEYTTLGFEKKRLGTWRYDIAHRFDLRVADSPEGALLADKEAVVYASSQLLEEGWATWIEHHFRRQRDQEGQEARAGQPPRPNSRYSLTELWHVLSELAESAGDPESGQAARAVQSALSALFLDDTPSSEQLHSAVLTVHHNGPRLDGHVTRRLGQPLRYVVGYLLMRDLESRQGSFCVPYAVTIAANVMYRLETVAAADLCRLVAQDARLNVDSRLAHLRLLTLQRKGDVAELAGRAHHELNLAVPEALRS